MPDRHSQGNPKPPEPSSSRRDMPTQGGRHIGPRYGAPGETEERGQTAIDFVVGASVFLLTVGIVFGTVPGLTDPFSQNQAKPLVADRLTAQVAERMLGEPGQPSVLNQTCVNAFFNGSLADGGSCPVPFDENATDLPDRLGVDDRHRINVSLLRDSDGNGELTVLSTSGDEVGATGHTELAIGPAVPTKRAVVGSRRAAVLDGKDVIVVVKVW